MDAARLRPAVEWCAYLPYLAIIEGSLAPTSLPDWAACPATACLRRAHRKQAASRPPRGAGRTAAARTVEPGRPTHRSALAFPLAIPLARRHPAFGARFLAAAVEGAFTELQRTAATAARCRRELERVLVRHFRRSSGTAAAIFCHLGLVVIDIERVRGAILRRLLFANDAQRGAP